MHVSMEQALQWARTAKLPFRFADFHFFFTAYAENIHDILHNRAGKTERFMRTL